MTGTNSALTHSFGRSAAGRQERTRQAAEPEGSCCSVAGGRGVKRARGWEEETALCRAQLRTGSSDWAAGEAMFQVR